MVNASLNWASIVGIVLAVGGALLYFMRSFKPALARDYDVFFAAVGLLCDSILFFQGWRLDPILQFGQFLLAGTTVFFAYESVRLRGVTTEQARRSSYFDEEEPAPFRPRGGLGGAPAWERERGSDRFEEPEPVRRRIRSREDEVEDDFYRPRRSSRAAIPERAVSRRPAPEDWDDRPRERGEEPGTERPRYTAGGAHRSASEFGARRRDRESGEVRRGTRPVAGGDNMPRSSRRPAPPAADRSAPPGVPQGDPIRRGQGEEPGQVSDADFTPIRPTPPRDNSSRFDD
ncbi:MAG: Ycf66 family protein [Synechococcaceae cyanobacterium]|nr:Ycf66 family protein [Synechococcaceae cyanobacterium]